MGRAMRKRVFRHMRTAEAQISLRIPAVWLGHSLSLIESLDTTEYMNEEQRPGWLFALAQDDRNLRILHMFERLTRPKFASVRHIYASHVVIAF